jgi:hypothetical protein
MKVLVLGCGPAGLLATYAAEQFGSTQVIILSVKRPSRLHGCQFLHEPIPGLTLSATTVQYTVRGTAEDYARKVYGTDRPPVVSPQLYAGERSAWDIREMYRQLWERYEPLIIDSRFSAFDLSLILEEFHPDRVISTVPRSLVCQRGAEHLFRSQRCWALGDAPEEGQRVPLACPEDTVICDGTRQTSYYRLSRVFGYTTVEWSGAQRRPPLSGICTFDKPLSTDCDCWPEWSFFGRYGRWKKGELVHQVYPQTLAVLGGVAP